MCVCVWVHHSLSWYECESCGMSVWVFVWACVHVHVRAWLLNHYNLTKYENLVRLGVVLRNTCNTPPSLAKLQSLPLPFTTEGGSLREKTRGGHEGARERCKRTSASIHITWPQREKDLSARVQQRSIFYTNIPQKGLFGHNTRIKQESYLGCSLFAIFLICKATHNTQHLNPPIQQKYRPCQQNLHPVVLCLCPQSNNEKEEQFAACRSIFSLSLFPSLGHTHKHAHAHTHTQQPHMGMWIA